MKRDKNVITPHTRPSTSLLGLKKDDVFFSDDIDIIRLNRKMIDDDAADRKECIEESETSASSSSTTVARSKQQEEATVGIIELEIARIHRRLKQVQTELRITTILKNELKVKLDRTQKELIEAQTKVYTTSKKHEKIMNYINWLDYEYKTEEGFSRTVSTKFIRDNLS